MKSRAQMSLVLLMVQVLVLGAALASLPFLLEVNPAESAWIYDGISQAALARTTIGRQALIGSIWWPPLHGLLRLAPAAIWRTSAYPVSSLLVSALSGAACLLLLRHMLLRWRVPGYRWLLAAVALSPGFLQDALRGGSGTTVLFSALLFLHGLYGWGAKRSSRSIVYFAMASALLLWSDFNAAVWMLLVFVPFFFELRGFRGARSQREAVCVLALLPVGYALALWILLNWLLMGDGLFFLRSLARPPAKMPVSVSGPELTVCVAAALAGMTGLCAGVRHRCRGLLLCGAAIVLLPVVTLAQSTYGLLLTRAFLPSMILPLTIAFCGCLLATWSSGSFRLRAGLAASLLGITLAMHLPADSGLVPEGGSALRSPAIAQRILPLMEQRIAHHEPHTRVLICGYAGFLLLHGYEAEHVELCLDLDLNALQDSFAGPGCYLLIQAPVGVYGRDNVHWRYPGLYHRARENLLLERVLKTWHLFELISVPVPASDPPVICTDPVSMEERG